MMHIMICEDEPSQLKLLEGMVKEWAKRAKAEVQVDLCQSAEAFFFLWEEKKNTDIAVLDIEMPGMDGMELARRLRRMGEDLEILFVTGLADYALEGYEVDAISYLLKPVEMQRFSACLEKAWERRRKREPELVVEGAGEVVKVRLSDICYLESAAHNTMLYCRNRGQAVLSKTGILQMERQLAEKSSVFFKIHRSYLINLAYVERIAKKEVVMEDGQRLPIARGRWEAVNEAYLRYYRGRITGA